LSNLFYIDNDSYQRIPLDFAKNNSDSLWETSPVSLETFIKENSAYRYTMDRNINTEITLPGSQIRFDTAFNSFQDESGNTPDAVLWGDIRANTSDSRLCTMKVRTVAEISANAVPTEENPGIYAEAELKTRRKNENNNAMMPVWVEGVVYDLLGNKVRSLESEKITPEDGNSAVQVKVIWDSPCLNDKGRVVAAGAYIMRFTAVYEDGVREDIGTYKVGPLRPDGGSP
ncbi:MAG: hypothetical protein ACLFQK_02330, partial [Fibrobacterota bacterium]